MLDTLIDRKDRYIAGAPETPVSVKRRKVPEDLRRAIRLDEAPVDRIGPRKVQRIAGDRFGLIRQQRIGVVAEQRLDIHVCLPCEKSAHFNVREAQSYGTAAIGTRYARRASR